MYRKDNPHQMKFQDFYLPFGGELDGENRWVILAAQIPWQQIEQEYSELFSEDEGCTAKTAREALGSLIIKERLKVSDRETVEQIRENPYLQYFLGYAEFSSKPPFHNSMLTLFRQRFGSEALKKINEMIVENAMEKIPETAVETSDDDDTPSNNGKLIADATCAPADITYPTDLKLLNKARELSEEIIDAMHAPFIGKQRKPRTYRRKARKDYLAVVKQKKPGYKKIRKAVGKQIRYLKRNLKTIQKQMQEGLLGYLSKRMYRNLLVIQELYRQQAWMHENHTHKIADRIVSIPQPHVRPIVRGKARSNVEFGAKVSVSLVNGFSFVDRISWDSYNESGDLISQIKDYYRRFGCYPESVHVDKIYRTRENRRFCKKHKIRISGPPLGRPKKVNEMNASALKQERQIYRQDEKDRNAVEGKFGQGKRRFTLGHIMAKLAKTSETAITISFIVMNLEKILSTLLYFLFNYCQMCRISLCGYTARFQNQAMAMQIAA